MRCRAIVTFTTARGEVPAGSILNIPDHLLPKLSGKVEALPPDTPIVTAAPTWPPTPRAFLDNDQLRVTGVFPGEWPDGGLAPEIVRLTAGNLSLQKKLLVDTVAVYSMPQWKHVVTRWRELAAYHFEQHGLGLHPANLRSAGELHLLAFASELRLKKVQNTLTGH